MRLKNYLNEQYIYDAITYEVYCKMLDNDNIDEIVENCLNESAASDDAKKRGLHYIGFGRYTSKDDKDTVIAVSKSGKLVDIEPRKAVRPETKDDEEKGDESGDESDKIRIKNIGEKMKKHVSGISSDLGVSKDHVIEAFKQKSVYGVLKHFGFSVKGLARAAEKSISTLNVSLRSTIQELEKTKALKKLKAGAIKVDEFLDDHKTLKRITGAAVAGFMIYQWLNMTFSGDIKDDYDLTALPAALAGTYGMKDLLGTTNGLKGMVQLGIGLATGGGLPIWLGGIKGIKMALVFSGAMAAKNTGLAKKAKDKIKSMFKKGDKKGDKNEKESD